MNSDVETADQSVWLDPEEVPPPRGKKLLLLTPYGIATLGHWDAWFAAWAPLPRVPQPIKEKIWKSTLA